MNQYAQTHADASVERLNIHIRSSLVNAVDEGIIPYDFTKNAVIKGEAPSVKEKDKFLDYEEFQKLMQLAKQNLNLHYASRFMILIAVATGMRFAELLGLTWDHVDSEKGIISVDRAWDYQDKNDFCPTKNPQSIRKVPIDVETVTITTAFKEQ